MIGVVFQPASRRPHSPTIIVLEPAMLRTRLSLLVFLGLAVAAHGEVLFSDSCSGSSINTTNWTTSTPFSDSSIAIGSGIAALALSAKLQSRATFNELYGVSLSFAFTKNTLDLLLTHSLRG